MKQFEKWWKEASKDDRRYAPEDDYVAKDGWKAALEWVLDDLKAAREGFDLGLYDTINKELETE